MATSDETTAFADDLVKKILVCDGVVADTYLRDLFRLRDALAHLDPGSVRKAAGWLKKRGFDFLPNRRL